MKLSRLDVRNAVDCPECGAPAGDNCVGKRHIREANHQSRINAASKLTQP